MAEVIGDAAVSALGAELVVVSLTDDHGRARAVLTGVAPGAVNQVLIGPIDRHEIVAQPIAVERARSAGSSSGRRPGRPFSDVDRGFVHVLAGLFALALDRPRAPSRPLRLGDLAIDLQRHEVSIDGRAVRLTPSELRLLLLLAEQPGLPGAAARSFATCPAPTPPATNARATCTSPTCAASSAGPVEARAAAHAARRRVRAERRVSSAPDAPGGRAGSRPACRRGRRLPGRGATANLHPVEHGEDLRGGQARCRRRRG